MIDRSAARHLLIRLSIAVIFIGIGIWEVLQPVYWVQYLPTFASNLSYADSLVVIHGIALAAIGIAVLLGFHLRLFSALAALMMLAIMADLAFYGLLELFIRDLPIFLIAVSLYLDDEKRFRITP